MWVKDIELLKNIDILFDNEIILYGAGYYGRKAIELLEGVGIEASCFCDSNEENTKQIIRSNVGNKEYKVVGIKELKVITEQRKVIIIITSMQYIDQILDMLVSQNINQADIFSYAGLNHCINMNIESGRINQAAYKNYIRKEIMELREQNRKTEDRIKKSSSIIFNMQCYKNPGILIFQPGKVGSTTIYESLVSCDIPCIHLHFFEGLEQCEMMIKKLCDEVKIITLIREPISRDIASYMHRLTDEKIYLPFLDNDTIRGIRNFFDTTISSPYGEEFSWFDNLKEFTGIDIFRYPFDKDKGYSIVENGKWRILILKLEKLNDNQKIIGEFVGVKNFKLINSNVGKKKNYRYIYEDVKKNLLIPAKVVDKYYNCNERMDYFYTEEEKKEFLRKYRTE